MCWMSLNRVELVVGGMLIVCCGFRFLVKE